MSPAERRRVAATLTLKIAPDGGLLAVTPTTRTQMGLDAIVVLCAFSQAATLDEAYASASATFDLGRADFDAMVTELTTAGSLVLATTSNLEPASDAAALSEQLGTLRDLGWLLNYRVALERAAPDKIVVDLTGGAGVLAVIAAKAGARKVYAITSAGLAAPLREIIAANQVADRVELVIGDRDELAVPERGQLLVHDLVGANPFANRALSTVDKVRERLLVPDAQLLPFRIDLSFVGVDVTHADELAEDHFVDEIARLVGIDLQPLAVRMDRLRARRPMTGPIGGLSRHVITDEVPFVSIDLRRPWRDQVPPQPVPLDFTVKVDGRLAGLAGLIRVHLDDRTVIGNHPSMPSTAVRHTWHGLPVSQAMYVLPKDRMALTARVERGTDIVVELA